MPAAGSTHTPAAQNPSDEAFEGPPLMYWNTRRQSEYVPSSHLKFGGALAAKHSSLGGRRG
eukprot:9093086-Alexandrium_andersonii.AAC.1